MTRVKKLKDMKKYFLENHVEDAIDGTLDFDMVMIDTFNDLIEKYKFVEDKSYKGSKT